MLKGFDIICFCTYWDDPWGSKQRVMELLSKSNRILYVEYPQSILHYLFYPHIRKYLFKKSVRFINKNLIVYRPIPLLPFWFYSKAINKFNLKVIYFLLQRKIKKFGFRNLVLWTFLPNMKDLITRLDGKLSIYQCVADFINEKKNSLRMVTIRKMEEDLLGNVDIVFASTQSLYNRFKAFNKNVYLSRSAVSDDIFCEDSVKKIDELNDLKNIESPRLGFVGYIDGNTLDIQLLESIASYNKEWNIVLVGMIFRQAHLVNSLRKYKNIHFLGKKNQNLLPSYIANFDVCLIPYVVNEFTYNVSPLKLYEYLSLGKPVVSVALEEILQYLDIVRIAHSKDEFIKAIEGYLRNDSVLEKKKRKIVAQDNCWKKRVESISEVIENTLKLKSVYKCD